MASQLPDYVASAQPVPQANRMPWFASTAQTYAGIMLWFVFWESVPISAATPGGILAQGLGGALIAVVLAGFICHFASYWAPAMMGMKTGLPLAVVGTSTYGVQGGFLMPGFFMGILQFGWLAVNSYFSAMLLAKFVGYDEGTAVHMAIGIIWAIVAALVGLKGIQYVAKVATFLPLIPFVILLVLLAKTIGGLGGFSPDQLTAGAVADSLPSSTSLMLLAIANIVGFFATAGAAGVDIASSNRDEKDVQLGGLVGVAGATIFTGCLALLIVAGAYGSGLMEGKEVILKPTALMETIMGEGTAKIFWLLLAIAAFPPACFSSLVAAASFRNTLPKVNPFISCGIGYCVLDRAGRIRQGRSGGRRLHHHRCLLRPDLRCHDRRLHSLRNEVARTSCRLQPGRLDLLGGGLRRRRVRLLRAARGVDPEVFTMPCPPVAAIIVGFVLYALLAKVGLESETLEMPTGNAPAEEPAAG